MAGLPEEPPAKVEEEPAPSPDGASKNKKMIALLVRVAIFAGLAAGAFAVVLFVVRPLLPPPAAGEAKPRSTPEKFGRVVSLDSVVVNVAQTEGRRYLKATIQIEVPEEEKVVKEVEARKPQLLDLLVSTLTKKSLAEVTAPDALDRLRTEVQERVSQDLGRERVRRVFITEFVVQ
ncbi:MAG TPA: flagellar basal body-associated FliL family protein [Candidatus Methylomirabilis sp.]|nr:flagellar basal body-associated FliL family protein [Candidatus Methylomirabilis sp.]